MTNLSVSRRIRLRESMALQLRLESFNLPNHPNFNLPENRVDIISGGTITRAKNNRNFQLGARPGMTTFVVEKGRDPYTKSVQWTVSAGAGGHAPGMRPAACSLTLAALLRPPIRR